MRIVIRVAVVVLGLVLVAVVGLALALPRVVGSDAVRARIEEAARDATGRPVEYGDLEIGILPPRLVVREPRVLAAAPEEAPLFAAEDVALAISLWPLLQRSLVVESIEVRGANARLVRTEEGLVHAFAPPEQAEQEPPREREEERGPREESDRDFSLDVRQVELRGSALHFEDRTVSPPVTLELRELDAEARGDSLDAPIDFELRGVLGTGGRLRATGRRHHDDVALDLALDGVRLEAVAPYLDAGQKAAGAATGTIVLRETPEGSGRLKVDLVVEDGRVESRDLALLGRLRVVADLASRGPAEGTFEIDATDAEIRYGSGFAKPPGQAATASGRLVETGDGLRIQDTNVRVRNLDAELRLDTGARMRGRLIVPPFELEGWEELVPALAELAPRGRLEVPQLDFATAPLELTGRVRLDEVRLRPEAPDGLLLVGAVEAMGRSLRTRDLVATLAGQSLRVDAEVADLAGSPRFTARVEGEGLETGPLLEALMGDGETLQGPLSLRGRFEGPVAGERPLAQTVTGGVTFEIAPGRLRGISLLHSVFDELGTAGEAAAVVGRVRGDRNVERFYEDEFERLGGSLQLADGRARTDDLKLDYQHYDVELRGSVGLADRSLDLKGRLTIHEEVDQALSGEALAEGEGRRRIIPLARVTGTLDSPHVVVDPDDAVRFAALYATERRKEKWERKIDERLGEGSGREVIDALERILVGE